VPGDVGVEVDDVGIHVADLDTGSGQIVLDHHDAVHDGGQMLGLCSLESVDVIKSGFHIVVSTTVWHCFGPQRGSDHNGARTTTELGPQRHASVHETVNTAFPD